MLLLSPNLFIIYMAFWDIWHHCHLQSAEPEICHQTWSEDSHWQHVSSHDMIVHSCRKAGLEVWLHQTSLTAHLPGPVQKQFEWTTTARSGNWIGNKWPVHTTDHWLRFSQISAGLWAVSSNCASYCVDCSSDSSLQRTFSAYMPANNFNPLIAVYNVPSQLICQPTTLTL